MMYIKELTSPGELNSYNGLMEQIGSFFSRLEWLSAFKENIKIFGLFNDNEILGGFYLYEKRGIIKYYKTPPFTPHIGPFFKLNSRNKAKINSEIKEIGKSIALKLGELSAHSIVSAPLTPEWIDTQPFFWERFSVSVHYTYKIDLSKELKEIWDNFSKERRNDIKRALRDGIKIKIAQPHEYNNVIQFLNNFLANKNINLSYFLQKSLINFLKTKKAVLMFAEKEGNVIYAAFFPYDYRKSYYLIGGGRGHRGAGALLIWEAINFFKNKGLKFFDFEGSMIPSIEKYFRGFGGDLVPYYRVSKAPLFMELGLKFFKRQIF